MSEAFVAPVDAMLVVLVEMLLVFARIAAALVAPVDAMLVVLVEMLVAFVAAAAALVAPVDAILDAFVTVSPETVLMSPVADVT